MKLYFDYLSKLNEGEKKPAKQVVKESKKLNESVTDFDIDEFIDWLGDYPQAYDDCKDYFGDDINDIDEEDLISWLADHEQISADWKRYLGESKKRMNEKWENNSLSGTLKRGILVAYSEDLSDADGVEIISGGTASLGDTDFFKLFTKKSGSYYLPAGTKLEYVGSSGYYTYYKVAGTKYKVALTKEPMFVEGEDIKPQRYYW